VRDIEDLGDDGCALTDDPALLDREGWPRTVAIVLLVDEPDEAWTRDALRRGAADVLDSSEQDPATLRRAVLHAVERARTLDELARKNAELEALAIRDPVSGLLNRRGLDALVGDRGFVDRAHGGHLLAVRLGGLDRLEAEDAALVPAVQRAAAQSLRFRADDLVAHVDPTTFLVVLKATRGAEAAMLLERLRPRLLDAVDEATGGTGCALALGLAEIPAHCVGTHGLCALAEAALAESGQELSLETEALRELLDSEHPFSVETRPIVGLRTKATAGIQLVARPLHPRLDDVAETMRIAGRSGLLAALDDRRLAVFLEAVTSLGKGRFHVDVLPETIVRPEVLARLTSFDGELWIELSEQRIVGDPSALKPALAALRAAGRSVVLDDVGFGRSSLESLVVLEPDAVRIGQRWTRGVAKDDGVWRTLQRLVRVCEALGAVVIVDGLENAEEIRTVRSIGAELGMGPVFEAT
jgi:EAL domain-containing protein (putative c-di-GMP-specific phosphodiesterase class I)/GGDEF domain-containing protein